MLIVQEEGLISFRRHVCKEAGGPSCLYYKFIKNLSNNFHFYRAYSILHSSTFP